MRISDWSSDVCSSDLPRSQRMTSVCSLVHAGRLRPAFDDDHSEHPGGHVVHEVAVESPLAVCITLAFGESSGAPRDADCVLEGVRLAVSVAVVRAACREGVCPYV